MEFIRKPGTHHAAPMRQEQAVLKKRDTAAVEELERLKACRCDVEKW